MKQKSKKLKGCYYCDDDGGERVHVDIQFSSDQKVEGNSGGGSHPRLPHPPYTCPTTTSVRGFWLVENKVSRRIAEEIYGAISRPAWHSTIRINTFFFLHPNPFPLRPYIYSNIYHTPTLSIWVSVFSLRRRLTRYFRSNTVGNMEIV